MRRRHCRAMDGPSMPAPRSDDGAKEPGATRWDGLRGQALLVIFVKAGHPATDKSSSPGRAKPSTCKQLSNQLGAGAVSQKPKAKSQKNQNRKPRVTSPLMPQS